ncbi:MAG: proline--tRNA ligase [Neisseriaceae bacterium]|nr:MAG: proline--tRNA ligase [Neisseriaceae bacterium]
MRSSNYYISTLKEVPSEAELPSHRLMLKAGLIRKISSGLYSWMPIGLKVLHKVEAIVREEMNKAGALELLMPGIQPSELWQESGRWEHYGKELLRIEDRHNKSFCYGPTHEEVMTEIIRNEISSYRQLPVNFYQIQTKFRDEIRPRFGVMRSREFIMKDAYSFHESKESLRETYLKMYVAYNDIFSRLGLKFRAVVADNGSIGGSSSHEFQVLAENGEDVIVYSTESDYVANIELAPSIRVDGIRQPPQMSLNKVHTPNIKTIKELVNFLSVDIQRTIQTIVVEGENDELILLLLRGDNELNEVKAGKLEGVKKPLTFVNEEVIKKVFLTTKNPLDPIEFKGKVYADFALELGNDWIIRSDENNYHYVGFNFMRDIAEPEFVDIRNVVEGDISPDGKGVLKLAKGIEVGHIFELGNKYSKSMQATFIDNKGKVQFLEMGCYGIGITRIVAAAIEQNYDEKGIIWTGAMAPFTVIIVPLNYHKNESVKNISDKLYVQLLDNQVEVLLDDRNERSGVLLNDSELLGIPHRITVGERGLKEGIVEYWSRSHQEIIRIRLDEIVDYILNQLD